MKKLIYFSIALLLMVSSCEELLDKPEPVDQTITGEVDKPTRWTADKEWVIEGIVNVSSDLVIEPGTIVKFMPNAELSVGSGAYGSLKAIGTPEKPIVFTSATANPTPGNYRGITFFDNAASTSELAYCTVEYAGGNNGYKAAVYVYRSEISVHHSTIRKSANAGIINEDGSFGKFLLNTIAECSGYPIEIPASAVHLIDSTSSITGKGVLINYANLKNQNVTWQTLTVPYIVSNLDINDDAGLILSPGLRMHFLANGRINVGNGSYGKLVANGTATKPIVFTSASANPSAGNWRGIEFFSKADQNSSFNYSIIEYSGSSSGYGAAVYFYDCGISINNSIVRKSASGGILLDDTRLLSFENNTIEECNDYPLSLPATSVHKLATNNKISGLGVFINDPELTNQTVTWNKLTVPYHIDKLFIYDNGQLTLSAGVTMLFKSVGYIAVGSTSFGKLIADGTVNEPIVFSSTSSSPSAGDWRGLEFFSNIMNGTKLNHCKVLYGGNDYGYGANIYSYGNGTRLSITNSEIGYSETSGIYASDCTPTITNIKYTQNSTDFVND